MKSSKMLSFTPHKGTEMPKSIKSFAFNPSYFPLGKFNLFNSETKLNFSSVLAKIDEILLILDTCTGTIGKGYLNKVDLTEYPIIKDIIPFFIKTPPENIEQAYDYLVGDKAKDSYQ